jgi:hypothetical protein
MNFKNINWHVISIVLAALGAALVSLESGDPKHLQWYMTALFILHAIQSALGSNLSQEIGKLKLNAPPPSPPAVPPAAAATFCILFLALGFSIGDSSIHRTTPTEPTVTEVGCGSNPGIQPLFVAGENLGICIVQAAVGDLPEAFTDPASLLSAIASACTAYGIATAAQILATIEQAIASTPTYPDAGGDAGFSSASLLKLQKVRDAAAHIIAQNNVAAFGGTPK